MSDTFFQAAITANALFLTLGGLLVVNGLKEFSALETRLGRVIRFGGIPGRWLLVSMFILSVILGAAVFVWSLEALSSTVIFPSANQGLVGPIFAATILHLFVFSVSVGSNLGSIFRAGRPVADGMVQNP